MMWRRRLAGIYAVARTEGWHVWFIDVGELEHGVRPVLDYWKPDGVIVEGGVFRNKGCAPDVFADHDIVVRYLYRVNASSSVTGMTSHVSGSVFPKRGR